MEDEQQPDLDGKRMRAAIYAVVHEPSGKRLICGTGSSLSKRLSDQLAYLRFGKHYNPALQADLERDGADAFRFVFLDFVHREGQVGHMKRLHVAEAMRRGIALYNAPDPVTRRLLKMDRPQPSSVSSDANSTMKIAIERLKNLDLSGEAARQNALHHLEKLIADQGRLPDEPPEQA